MKTVSSLGVAYNQFGMAICLVSQRVDADQALYHVHAYRSTERTSPDTLKVWIAEVLQAYGETVEQPQTLTATIYQPSESLQKAKSWTRQAGQRFGRLFIYWREEAPIADRRTVIGDIKGIFNEGRVSVDSSQILSDLDRELNQCTRDESDKWIMTLGAEAIVLSLGEMEHRYQCGLNQRSSGMLVGKHKLPSLAEMADRYRGTIADRYRGTRRKFF